ncbi:MAG TPA: AEC family transporter [Micrococcaceae bacterium]|jgi:hypothetical protein|nr:AEC family transporter [Micrococcaceae bacterium]
MSGVVTGFAIIIFIILVGYVTGRTGIGGPAAESVLNRIAFFVTSPALLFTVLAKADLRLVFSSFVEIALVSAVVTFGLFVVLAKLAKARLSTGELAIGAMASGYVNANNIGLPVAVYVLGNASYVAPVLLIQLLVFAPVILTVLDVSSSGRASIGSILSQPLRNPMIIASVLGVVVALTGDKVPDAMLQPFVLLGGAAVPLVLLAFGMSLHGSRPLQAGSGRRNIIIASLLKSLMMPAVAFLCARFIFDLNGPALLAAVTLAALPSAQNTYNFASRYGSGVVLARDSVILTTVLAVPVLIAVAAIFA